MLFLFMGPYLLNNELKCVWTLYVRTSNGLNTVHLSLWTAFREITLRRLVRLFGLIWRVLVFGFKTGTKHIRYRGPIM